MNWWVTLAGDLVKPSWIAGLIQGALGSAIAFLGAFLLFRRQMRHDRRIADEQLAALGQDRVAEKRSAAADELGRELIEAADSFDSIRPSDLLALIRGPDKRPPASDRIYGAEGKGSLVLDLDSTVLDLWRQLNHTWDLVVEIASSHDSSDDSTRAGYALAAAAEALISSPQNEIRRLGYALVRWNGEGAIPGRSVLTADWEPIPLKDRNLNSAWKAGLESEFEEVRQHVLNKNKKGS